MNVGTYTPENFFAGDYPVAKGTGTAGAAIVRHEPVKLVEGEILPVTAMAATAANATNVIPARTAEENTLAGLYGIAANEAGDGDEITVYLTGDFFAGALALQTDVTVDALKPAFRKMGIFLK
jgi:hypothetical protein